MSGYGTDYKILNSWSVYGSWVLLDCWEMPTGQTHLWYKLESLYGNWLKCVYSSICRTRFSLQ